MLLFIKLLTKKGLYNTEKRLKARLILAYISPEVLPSPCACVCLCLPHYLGDVVVHMSPVMSLLYWNELFNHTGPKTNIILQDSLHGRTNELYES